MKRTKMIMAPAMLLLLMLASPAVSLTSWIKGALPDPHAIITQVVSKYLAQCTATEARANLDALGSEKKAALVNFLGESGKKEILSQCKGEVCGYVKTLSPAGTVGESDFQKIYPEILPIILNRMPMDRYNKFIISTEPEIGPEAIFLDWAGQAAYFKGLDPARHEIVLNYTPEWVFLEIGLRRYADIRDYTAILYKQERLGGELQGVETILVKYREKPKSIYMKWLAGPWKGREGLYNEALSKDKVRVRESGFLGVIPIWIHYMNPIAMRGSNHPVVDVGLKYILELNLREYKKASANNELARKNHGFQTVDGRKVFIMEDIMTRNNPAAKYYCHRCLQYMDYQNALEPKVEVFNWNNELFESFTYVKLKINPGLTDKDFDPKNPEYRL